MLVAVSWTSALHVAAAAGYVTTNANRTPPIAALIRVAWLTVRVVFVVVAFIAVLPADRPS